MPSIGRDVAASLSPPTARVLDVLEALAHEGAGRARFTDLVQQVGLTQGTAHAVLGTLVERGWVVRDPGDRTYRLGPAASWLASRAAELHPVAHAARAAAHRLSHELGLAASVVERAGPTLLVTAFEGATDPDVTPVGDRLPYTAPFGAAFAAWGSADERAAWMGTSGVVAPDLVRKLEQTLDEVRDRGYSVDSITPALAEIVRLVGTLHQGSVTPAVARIVEALLTEIVTPVDTRASRRSTRPRPIATISAPVLDRQGRVVLNLSIHPGVGLDPREIGRLGRRLSAVAASVGSS